MTMSSTIAANSPATGLEPEHDLPPDLNPETHRIIATHFYGVDLSDVRQIFWNQARPGYRLPAESNIIILRGGRS